MRILYLIPWLSSGGAERQLGYLATGMIKLGHNVHIAYIYDGPAKPALPDVHLHKFISRSNYDPRLLWQLFNMIRRIKPDIIHTWNPQMDILGGIVSRIKSIPWILSEPSSAGLYRGTWKDLLRVFLSSGAKAIIANSNGGLEYWRSKVPDANSYLIRNGILVDEIEKVEPGFPIDISDDVPVLLFVGRFEEKIKQPHLFIKAVAQVLLKNKVKGILCGDGPQMHALKKLRHDFDLDTHIHFTGFLPATKVWALMKKAAILISPSLFEGCPNTVLEAILCGCPLVISDIPAHREILDEKCALFFDPYSIQQMVDQILRTLNDAETSTIRCNNAKQKTQQWSLAEMARKHELIYKKILK